jgi:glycosyltransferase involved in cell wall biosynthesis
VPRAPALAAGERDRLRAAFPLEPGTVLLGAVGSLIERKGHHVLFEALASLEGRLAFHLAVAGEGERRAPLEALSAKLGLASRVTFLGHRDDAARWIGCLDLHVLASRLEGMPLCVLEAMAAGVPSVAFGIDGMDEVIEHGVNGLIAEPANARALAEAIVLGADTAKRRAMGEAARARYEEHFTLERMARGTEAVYEEALA